MGGLVEQPSEGEVGYQRSANPGTNLGLSLHVTDVCVVISGTPYPVHRVLCPKFPIPCAQISILSFFLLLLQIYVLHITVLLVLGEGEEGGGLLPGAVY